MVCVALGPHSSSEVPTRNGHLLAGSRRAIQGAVFAIVLAGCSDGGSSVPSSRSTTAPEVSVVTLRSQSVAITTELPGRTVASLVAEVRPQVNGIIQARLFQEGSEVTAGDVLYQIDPASYQAAYDSAVAALQRAEASIPNAEAKVKRYEGLTRQNAVSKQELDDAVAALAQARADVAAAKASVGTARINLDHTKITAPISGRVDRSSLTPGALVTASQDTALTTIRKLDLINVDVAQSSTNLVNLRQAIEVGRIRLSGANVNVRLKLDNGTVYPHPGKIEFFEANVDLTTGTFVLRAEFPNPDRLLLSGMYVRALVEEGIAQNSFAVPQRGVTRNARGEPTALVVNAEGKVEERRLVVGSNVGNAWLVHSGLGDGDRVIVEGSQFVRIGQQVSATEVTIDETTGAIATQSGGDKAASDEPTRQADAGMTGKD